MNLFRGMWHTALTQPSHKRGWITRARLEHAGSGFWCLYPPPPLLFFPAACSARLDQSVPEPTHKTFFSSAITILIVVSIFISYCATSDLLFVSFLSSFRRRGNFTVPKLPESNMGFGVLGVFLGLLLEVSTHGPHTMPRSSWRHQGKAGLWRVI